MKMRAYGLAVAMALSAWISSGEASPLKVGVFAGIGPRSNGAVEWFRLVEASPDMELTLLSAEMIRSGALDGLDVLIVPGGDSRTERRDIGMAGGEAIKSFIRRGGGYIGTCGGCCLAMDDEVEKERGIGIIPFRRTGSKGWFMMPVKVTAAGAKALGLEEREYVVRYHQGPVLEPTGRKIEDSEFEVWGTYASDFGVPGEKPEMVGRAAIVGGRLGKGRVFAIACHPESFPFTRNIVRGAFRYVSGREVTFPERKRKAGALSVGFYSPAILGVEDARTVIALDKEEPLDLFPVDADCVREGMLDHVDVLVLPDSSSGYYTDKKFRAVLPFVRGFQSRGGRIVGWGEGVKSGPAGTESFATPEALVANLLGK